MNDLDFLEPAQHTVAQMSTGRQRQPKPEWRIGDTLAIVNLVIGVVCLAIVATGEIRWQTMRSKAQAEIEKIQTNIRAANERMKAAADK